VANKALVEWFDSLEAVLEAEARLSGLFEHGSTIGQAREFLVTRVLKTVLPTGVHVGGGKVINHSGNSSKQVDVVVYDPRFPIMKVEGGALYFVEGVLATLEIKSTINSSGLNAALDNCKSVLELSPRGEHPDEAGSRIEWYMRSGGLTSAEAEQRFWYKFRPATYVFGFKTELSFETTCLRIQSWWNDIGCSYSAQFPLLPRVFTAGTTVGLIEDGRVKINSVDGTPHVMTIFETERRFRWLALHLMDSVSQRLGLRNFAEQFDYRLTDYYPFDVYLDEIRASPTRFIKREPTA
jgi:hypothetical protein